MLALPRAQAKEWTVGSHREDQSVPPSFILANLEFEYELFAPKQRKISLAVREHSRRFQHILRLLPQLAEARLWSPGNSIEALTPWGVSDKLGTSSRFPSLEVVRLVNDKRFSHSVELDLDLALPYSTVVTSIDELQELVAECPYDWVLKHPFGVSGRERMLNWAGVLTDSVRGWARKLFAQGLGLLFEPWVSARNDYSLHYHINSEFTPHYLGRCEIVPNQGGVYRGNIHNPESSKLDIADKVVERVAQAGYWGPVSLDCFRGTLANQTVERPLVEVNARYTFGRLTLALKPWIPEDWVYIWWHPMSAPAECYPRLPSRPQRDLSAGWYRLPKFADPDNLTGTIVGLAQNLEELRRLASSDGMEWASSPS